MFATALLSAMAFVAQARASDTELVHAILNAHESNRLTITYGRLNFVLREGKTKNEADAVAGRLNDERISNGTFVFNEELCLYTLDAKSNTSAVHRSIRMVTDGKTTMWDNCNDHNRTVQIDPGSNQFFSDSLVILGLGGPPGLTPLAQTIYMIDHGIRGYHITAVDPKEALDGHPVTKISMEYDDGGATFWVDVERGAIPLKFESWKKKDNSKTIGILDKLEHLANGAWYPRRWISRRGGGLTKVLECDMIDFVKRPSASAFDLTFSTPIRVINSAAGFSYEAQKTWNLKSLPSATSTKSRPLPRAATLPRTSIFPPPPKAANTLPMILVYASLTAVVALASIYYMYRRAKHV